MACDLAALDGLALQAAINAKAAKHPRAGQLVYTTLHAALHKAVALGYIPKSPMDACLMPAHQPAVAAVLDAQQLAAYLHAARAVPAWPLLLLMASCGLRRGEALGLRWSDIDAASGLLLIQRQRMRVHHGYQERPLKSHASRRVLPLAPPLLQELAQARAAQNMRALSGWVVDITPEALARAHQRVLAAAGLPHVTLHGLRHSMATASVAQGMPVRVLQGVLGHAKYALTADLYAAHLGAAQYAPFMASFCGSLMGSGVGAVKVR